MSHSLKELEAYFIQYKTGIADETHGRKLPDGSTQWGGFEITVMPVIESLSEAQGIMFLCPLCFDKNAGPIGTHSIEVTFSDRNVIDKDGSHNKEGRATRWKIEGGSGLEDLRLSPSILIESGCNWHGFIGNNGIQPGHAG